MDARIDGAWKSPTRAEIYVGGQWKRVARAEVYAGGTWRAAETFLPPLSAAASPTETVGYGYGGSVTTEAVTVTPIGGAAPFTYSWARIGNIYGTPNSPTAATTTFTASLVSGDTQSSTFRCTVTDALGSTATADVSAAFVDIFIDFPF